MRFTWNFNKIFRNGIKNFKRYNRIHVHIPEEKKRILREITVPLEVESPSESNILQTFKDSRGKTIIVPIWKTELAKGSQN